MVSWRRAYTIFIPGALIAALGILVMVQEGRGQKELIYVELERSGGQVPTYRPTFRVDVKDLSGAHRKMLDRLLDEADFFHQPARFPKAGPPDAFEYRLHVQAQDGSHVLVFHDQDGHPPAIDTLADWIRAHPSQ